MELCCIILINVLSENHNNFVIIEILLRMEKIICKTDNTGSVIYNITLLEHL